jgi:hypothetical protein
MAIRRLPGARAKKSVEDDERCRISFAIFQVTGNAFQATGSSLRVDRGTLKPIERQLHFNFFERRTKKRIP